MAELTLEALQQHEKAHGMSRRDEHVLLHMKELFSRQTTKAANVESTRDWVLERGSLLERIGEMLCALVELEQEGDGRR